ncbi:MAG TPA: aminomethyl-transferring glycine dehydrogenase [Longimicrobiales bacterium]|nr:aminomethyl-transferring glycine dehydrogenase [Longimicrobiales bacterium]
MHDRHALASTDLFVRRHIGPRESEVREMLEAVGFDSVDDLVDTAVPAAIRMEGRLALDAPTSEHEALNELKGIASRNRVFRSYIGMGYSGTITPPVIQRNILENPGWYTAYTPYQAEISQGRLEALLVFQTMVMDLTGMEIANASLLDEATAAAEGMAMAQAAAKGRRTRFLVSDACHPQTIDVVRTRARARGWEVTVGDHTAFQIDDEVFGVLLQYPATDGAVHDYTDVVEAAHDAGALVIAAADLLSLTLLKAPGEWGADVVVGNTQRFGVPMGFGGPHAAYFATRDRYKRQMPGRIIGVSKDSRGEDAYYMALQTREQHIRRERATSNVCTAQVLLAVIAAMYAVYHGPNGLRRIAGRVHRATAALADALENLGYTIVHRPFFDTLRVEVGERLEAILQAAGEQGINVRVLNETTLAVALDETVTRGDLIDLIEVFGASAAGSEGAGEAGSGDARKRAAAWVDELGEEMHPDFPEAFRRETEFLTHPVFQRYHSETEMLRFLKRLENRDLSLTGTMIPLGSCTLKLNATAEMYPISWREFAHMHPFAPADQAEGYREMIDQLERWLAEITGFHAVSSMPNAGSQGELTGLLVIRAYHEARGEAHRDVCLIPQSAHGTNPASAVMAGLDVVVVKSDENGNIDVDDLRKKAGEHSDRLAAIMVTYPSTHGIFEESIREICQIVHENGGQVYIDGANMNAMVGVSRPGDWGGDVAHLNLHKTFAIPHGGGGPGMGPIGVMEHLAPFLPSHPVVRTGGEQGIGAVSAAPWGSPSILPISWMYIRMLGAEGVTRSTKMAILNANYVARRLEGHFDVLYTGRNGTVAHECIIDPRPLKAATGVDAIDIAKRLIDYGFHAPTVSFPVPGTLMVEPTESEGLEELDRFCDAMIAIREEIRKIENGEWEQGNNPVSNAPHTADMVVSSDWDRPYSREVAALPAPGRESKFWPVVGRVHSAFGDRNLVCACPPVSEYEPAEV